ncbi:MAG: uridine kinase [Clostridiales bacterium]|nr:uridine kinase [Clostridiales bacterium]
MKHTDFETLISAINGLLEKKEHVSLAIDGCAAAGKSTLAKELALYFAKEHIVNVIHMDDFFLPPALRTEQRLSESGGNVHYERFIEEVLPHLDGKRAFSYGIFDCSVMKVTRNADLSPAALTVVEGAYSMHPRFGDVYDLRVFLSADAVTQRKRILARNGEMMLKKFEEIWIPMEHRYFDAYGIKDRCDFVFAAEDTE